jgi:GNAT superfamily N-acetyltransferase
MFRITADLHAGDTDRISAHLLRLSPEDRSTRFFAGVVTEESIRLYVGRMRFGPDLVLGLVSHRGQLFGLAHGCVFEHGGKVQVEAAFSVDAPWRGLGLGAALMDGVRLRARALASDRVARVGMCATRNWPMRRIFEGAGLALRREDDEMHAHGWVPGRGATRSPAALRLGR